MYQLHRVFCATAWELEGERQAFYDVLGEFNEADAMSRGVLYVPVSLPGVRDKRPYQFTIDQNIRACRYYILAVADDWGPPERNFQRDYHLALECSRDPALPMNDIAFFVRQPLEGQILPSSFPSPSAMFSTIAEFKLHVREALSRWLAALPMEASGATS